MTVKKAQSIVKSYLKRKNFGKIGNLLKYSCDNIKIKQN